MSMIGKIINAGDAKIYKSVWDKRGWKQYFGNDPIYTVIGEHGNNLLVRHHSLSDGNTGWFKKDDVDIIGSFGNEEQTMKYKLGVKHWKLAKGHWALSIGIAHPNDETFLELELFKWVVLIGLMYK